MFLAHARRLPDCDEKELQQVVHIVDLLIERCVAGLSTLAPETRRWLKSAKREEVDVRPMGRLQNPGSQKRYARYWKQFVCYCLRIVAAEEEEGITEALGSKDDRTASDDNNTSRRNTETEDASQIEGEDDEEEDEMKKKMMVVMMTVRTIMKTMRTTVKQERMRIM